MENQINTDHKIKKEIALWELSDKAQLSNFMEKWAGDHIMVGFNRYEIKEGFMEDDTNVPYIELVNVKTRECKWVQLSLIDDTYVNHSAEGQEGRDRLYKELGINPDEVVV